MSDSSKIHHLVHATHDGVLRPSDQVHLFTTIVNICQNRIMPKKIPESCTWHTPLSFPLSINYDNFNPLVVFDSSANSTWVYRKPSIGWNVQWKKNTYDVSIHQYKEMIKTCVRMMWWIIADDRIVQLLLVDQVMKSSSDNQCEENLITIWDL